MTPKQEALKLALDCVSTLANARDWVGCNPNERWDEDEMYAELCNATICLKKSLSIIQEALAEQPAQQQEPVVWMYQNKSTHEVSFQKHMRSFVDHGAWYEVPLYSEPLANQEKTSGSPIDLLTEPADEPVAYTRVSKTGHVMVCAKTGAFYALPDGALLYTRPQPAAQWVGLEPEEIWEIAYDRDTANGPLTFARAIEAKLREKNGGGV